MKPLTMLLSGALLLAGCDDAVGPNDRGTWVLERTARGVIAVSADWLVTAGNGDLDSGVVTGVNVYFRGEPVGGGGIYDFQAEGRVWNEWVPFLVPTRPGYSALRSFGTRGDTLVLDFADSVALVSNAPETRLEFHLRMVLDGGSLDLALGGMHMVFFPMRTGEAYTISCRSAVAAHDTTLVISHASADWAFDFVGPSSYELRSAHFDIAFATDAPLMKLGVGRDGIGSGGLVKYDLDHSLHAVPPRYYVNSRLTVSPNY